MKTVLAAGRFVGAAVLASAFAFDISAQDAPSLWLVKDGTPSATILLGKEPARAAQLAAFELQHHVREITGAALPIAQEPAPAQGVRILVGESEAAAALGLKSADLKPQEYLIRFLPDALALVGRDKEDRGPVQYDIPESFPGFWDERGSLHAVYEFLERFCNVRWFNPTEVGTDLPHSPNLRVTGKDLRAAPVFRFRDAAGARGDNPASYEAYTALWPATSDAFKKYEAEAYSRLHQTYPKPPDYNRAKARVSRLFLLRMRNGGEISRCNHSLYGYYDRFWEKNPKLPEVFVEKRADWFAQGYEGKPPQMCYTSRGLIAQLAQDARDYYDGKKTGKDLCIFWNPTPPNPFPVEPMDNSAFCKCAQCQAWLPASAEERTVYSTGRHSDYFFNFVNEVAKELRKTHPDKPIITLAYMTHAFPPQKFKLEPNVIVQYCFASNRMPYALREYENDLNALASWVEEAKTSKRELQLWLYYTFPVEVANNGKFHCFPGFFAHKIGEQFRLFHKSGITGMFHCGYGQEVEAYVTFKLMNDPTQDVDALLDDYFQRMYGEAGEPMKKFYLAVEQIYCDPANYPKERVGHQNAQIAWGRLGTKERMEDLESLLNRARMRVKTNEEKQRLRLFELSVWSYMAEGRRRAVARKTAPMPALTAPRVPVAAGDPSKVNLDTAAPLDGPWYDRGQDVPAARKLSGRIAHDGKFLYLELTDCCDPGKLITSATVFPCDDWEVFIAKQRALPYRQYAVGPTGIVAALSHGEVNWRMNVRMEDHGIKTVSDTSSPDRWVTRMAVPLGSVVAGGVLPGEKLYLNVIRVSSPSLKGGSPLGIDTWVSFCTVHEVDRLAEITLQE